MPSDYSDILSTGSIRTLFQPLVSVKRKAILGYEALSRGIKPDGSTIQPQDLFNWARETGNSVELDRLCRDRALDRFLPVHKDKKDLILSINLNTAVLDQGVVGSGHLFAQAKRWGVNPNNVVIEVIESEVEDTEALITFIRTYREHGFLIALDDVGTGYSNLERLALIRPDVIKIDRSLITGIDTQFTKKEVVRSLVALGSQIGAMTVGEGVEREEEAATLLGMGVDVFQGFWFARPFAEGQAPEDWSESLMRVAKRFKEETVRVISKRKERAAAHDRLVQGAVHKLAAASGVEHEVALVEFVTEHEEVECVYILDEQGIQVSDTICNLQVISENKRFIYQPAQKGADHSLKRYFLPLTAGLDKYTTEPYISLASGNLCTTISCRYLDGDRVPRILCLDIVVPAGVLSEHACLV